MRGPGEAREIVGRVDQRQMRERLGEIAKLTPIVWVVFLGEQPDVVAQRQETIEQGARVVVSAEHDIIVGQPKAAGQECAFSGGQSVGPFPRVVAQHQSVSHELALYRRDGAPHPRIVRRQKTNNGNQQETGVQRLRSERLNERVLIRIEAALADLLMNGRANVTPALERTLEA